MNKKLLSMLCAGVIIMFSGGCDGESTKSPTKEQVAEANTHIVQVLSNMGHAYDEVEKINKYSTIPNFTYPAQNGIYWTAFVKDNKLTENIDIVHFSSDIGWISWDKLIFSTDEGNWEYTINSFAGQSGNGKHTHIVMGGKYEVFSGPIEKIAKGLELVAKGKNPIIRLQGKEGYFDYRLTDSEINTINTALYTYNESLIMGGKVDFPKE